jgi:probable F420-dependent oxidoreductase
MSEHPPQYGVLLPHFGRYANAERLLESSQLLERLGFDSLWVRDHLVFRPHPHEDQDHTHVDPLVVLSGIAGVTRTIKLATGTLIPHRHPIHTALLLGSLDFLAGPHRLIVGWGIGTYQHEFDAAGMGHIDRREIIREQIEIMRLLWTGRRVTHRGKYYQFDDVDICPVPAGGTLPIWYGGMSPASVRRAVEYCDGWIPGRMPLRDFRRLMRRMRRLAEETGKTVPLGGVIPYVVPARTESEAVARYVDLPRTIDEAQRLYMAPPSGRFETLDDLDGAVIAGPPDRIIEWVRAFQAEGAQHFVFDLRLRFADWDEVVHMLGEEVLPELRRGDGAATSGQLASTP